MASSSDRPPPSETDLIGAIRDLTDGLTDLVRHQIELVRTEFRQELDEFRQRGVTLLIAAATALLGYLITLVGIVLVAAWLGGLAVAGPVALGLGALHLFGGAFYAGRQAEQLDEQRKRIRERTNLARELPEADDAPDRSPVDDDSSASHRNQD